MLEAFATDVEIPLKYGVDQCVGDTLCIGGIMYGQHGHKQIARALGRDKKDVDIICAGLNHQTWYISVKTDGIERTGDLYELMAKADFAEDENIFRFLHQ